MTQAEAAILVTGATGFLGRRLCERLQAEGARVVALGRHAQPGPWHAFLECDLAVGGPDPRQLAGISTVYHLASKAHAVSENAADALDYQPVIVEGTRRMAAAARAAGVERFLFMSSVKAMGEGNPDGIPLAAMDETWPHTPQGPYGLAKFHAEQIVRSAGFAHAVVLRPVMAFGPGEKGNLPRLVEAVRRGRFPPLPDAGNRRSMIHVEDLVEFAVKAAIMPIAAGRTYILTGPESPSTRQLYDAVRLSLGLPPRDWAIPAGCLNLAAWAGSVLGVLVGRRLPLDRETLGKLTGSAWYSARRAERELGYTARHPVTGWLASRAPA